MPIYRIKFAEWPCGLASQSPGLSFRELLAVPRWAFEHRIFDFQAFDEDDRDVSPAALPDFAWASSGLLAASPRLAEFVDWLHSDGCRIATIRIGDDLGRKLVLPEAVLSVFDADRSTFTRFKSSGRIKHVRQWQVQDADNPPPVFRVELEGEASIDLFVSAEFIARYSAVEATGLSFELVSQTG